MNDHFSKSGVPSSAMRKASAREAGDRQRQQDAEDDGVLGLRLDADAVGALDVAAHDGPAHADRQRQTGSITHERVALVDAAVQELEVFGQLVVDLEHRGDGQQDQEAEVDERVHDAGGGVAQQRLHVDAGAEVGQAALHVLRRGGPVVGLAPLPVARAVREQHGAVEQRDRHHDVEDDLEHARHAAEDLAGHGAVVVPLREGGEDAGAHRDERQREAEPDDGVRCLEALAGGSGRWRAGRCRSRWWRCS